MAGLAATLAMAVGHIAGPEPFLATQRSGAEVAFAAVVGLVIGSFLNVVAYRVPLAISISSPPSACPRCGHRVRWFDNVPVISWLALRGRCRDCGEAISIRYPVFEAITCLAFGGVALALGVDIAVLGMCVLAATLIALAATELDGASAPGSVAVVGSGAGLCGLVAASASDGRWRDLGHALGGGAVGVLVGFAVCAAASRARAGAGRELPVKWVPALLPAGLWAGWLGARSSAAWLISSLAFTLLFVLTLPASRREGRGFARAAILCASRASALAAAIALVVAVV